MLRGPLLTLSKSRTPRGTFSTRLRRFGTGPRCSVNRRDQAVPQHGILDLRQRFLGPALTAESSPRVRVLSVCQNVNGAESNAKMMLTATVVE